MNIYVDRATEYTDIWKSSEVRRNKINRKSGKSLSRGKISTGSIHRKPVGISILVKQTSTKKISAIQKDIQAHIQSKKNISEQKIYKQKKVQDQEITLLDLAKEQAKAKALQKIQTHLYNQEVLEYYDYIQCLSDDDDIPSASENEDLDMEEGWATESEGDSQR